jgi:hypothetical protein
MNNEPGDGDVKHVHSEKGAQSHEYVKEDNNGYFKWKSNR